MNDYLDYRYATMIVHSGIKGQKWGVRRYQNEDGTWTEAGKERYGDDVSGGTHDKNVLKKIGDRREVKFNGWVKTHKLNKNYSMKDARSDSRRFGLHGVKSINHLMNKGKTHLWARNAVSIAQGYAMQSLTGLGLYSIKFKED